MSSEATCLLSRALGDPTRIRILSILGHGEICVGDLVAVLRCPQPTASRHLGSLRRAGLVVKRKRQKWCFYSLPTPPSALQAGLLEFLEACQEELPDLQRDRARLTEVQRSGGCCPLTPCATEEDLQ